MNKKLLIAVIAVVLSSAYINAVNLIPYLPMQSNFGGMEVVDLSTFEPSLEEFTLDITADAVGVPVEISMLGITYTPQVSTEIRFVLYKEKVYIYEGTQYKETQTPSLQVIPGENNLLKNPGFEESTASGNGKTTPHWTVYNMYDQVNTNAGNPRSGGVSGSYNFFMRGQGGTETAEHLVQEVNSLKANTSYLISYWYRANNTSASHAGSIYQIELRGGVLDLDPENGFVAITGPTIPQSTDWRQFTGVIETGDIVPTHFCLHRTNPINNDGQYDYVDDFDLREAIIERGITGASVAYYKADIAVAPEFTPDYAAGDVFDMYPYYLQNPGFDINLLGWTMTSGLPGKRTSGSVHGDFTGSYWDVWQDPLVGKIYQTFTNIPNGKYCVQAALYAQTYQENAMSLYANASKTYVENTDQVYRTVDVVVVDGALEIGVEMNYNRSCWAAVDNFSLLYYGPDNTAQANALLDQIASLQTLLQSPMNAVVQANLESKMLAAGSAATADPLVLADLEAAADELNEAVSEANASVVAYLLLNSYLTSAETELDTYSGYSGFADYSNEVSGARGNYIIGIYEDADVTALILALKMARNDCLYSDGAIHNELNLLYGWDANEQDGITPEEAGWIATNVSATWGEAQNGSDDSVTAHYRKNALKDSEGNNVFAFMGYGHDNDLDKTIITYAYPVYLEAGKNYLFTGSNWRRNGQSANSAAEVTFAISSTIDASGNILGEETIYCDKEGYENYSFAFTALDTGVHYLIRFAERTINHYQDASANLLLQEAYKITFELNEGEGEKPEDQFVLPGGLVNEPTSPTKSGYTFSGWFIDGSTLWDFENDVTSDIILTAGWDKDNLTTTSKYSSIDDLIVQSGFDCIKVVSKNEQRLNVYSISGQIVKVIDVKVGVNTIPLNKGIYIINNKKSVVK